MKKIFLFAFLICISSVVFVSCCDCGKKKTSTTTTTTTPEVQRDFAKEGYVPATVIFSDLETCPYLLVLASEKRLEPSVGLAAAFQQDKLFVWIKYAEKKGGMSVCMAGTLVDIADIQLRK